MTNKQILILNNVLRGCLRLTGVKFAYATVRNLKLLAPIVEGLEKAIDFSYDYRQYDKEREELCQKYCERDDKDKPVIKNRVYQFNEDNKHKFESAIKALNEIPAHKAAIEARKLQEEEYSGLLELVPEDMPNLHKVKVENVPEGITGEEMMILTDRGIVTED